MFMFHSWTSWPHCRWFGKTEKSDWFLWHSTTVGLRWFLLCCWNRIVHVQKYWSNYFAPLDEMVIAFIKLSNCIYVRHRHEQDYVFHLRNTHFDSCINKKPNSTSVMLNIFHMLISLIISTSLHFMLKLEVKTRMLRIKYTCPYFID